MPPAALAAIPAITAAGTAVAGAASGGKGSPDQVQHAQGTTVKNTQFAPVGAQEQSLQNQSLQNYLAQQGQIGQQEQGLTSTFDPLRQQAAQAAGNVLNGQAFNLTPDEQAQIANVRNSTVTAGQQDIQNYLNQNLGAIQGSAGVRNLRGQALTSLQGGALNSSAQDYTRLVNAANATAAQQAQQAPLQRVAAQQNQIQQGLTLSDLLRNNAIQNRQVAQNPALLGMLQNERLAGGTSTQSDIAGKVYKGAPGSVGNAILGGIGGAAGGWTAGNDIRKALGSSNQPDNPSGNNNGNAFGAATAAGLANNAGGSASDFANDLRFGGNSQAQPYAGPTT